MSAPRLSRQQADELRGELERRHEALRQTLIEEFEDSSDTRLHDIAGRVRDGGEESVASLLADLNLLQFGRWVEEAQDIERALMDFTAGSYGICDNCGLPIAYERLKAEPAARRCYDCQRRYEQEYGGAGGDTM